MRQTSLHSYDRSLKYNAPTFGHVIYFGKGPKKKLILKVADKGLYRLMGLASVINRKTTFYWLLHSGSKLFKRYFGFRVEHLAFASLLCASTINPTH
jgi:hypothetical protein